MNSALMLLADGRFPAGGHTNSAGVEAAVRLGDIVDEQTMERYLRGRLATTGVVDAAFAARTVVAAPEEVVELDRELSARIVSPALRDASRRFGRQMLRAGSTVWATPMLAALGDVAGGPHQPLVLGALVGAAGGGPADAASIAVHHLSAAVCTASVRLLGLDPMHVAAVQALVAAESDEWISDAYSWADRAPADLPASGGSLTEILGELHAQSTERNASRCAPFGCS